MSAARSSYLRSDDICKLSSRKRIDYPRLPGGGAVRNERAGLTPDRQGTNPTIR